MRPIMTPAQTFRGYLVLRIIMSKRDAKTRVNMVMDV
jgi:hypothetical protein